MKLFLSIILLGFVSAPAFAREVTITVEANLTFDSTRAFEDGHIIFYQPRAYGYELDVFFASSAQAYCHRNKLEYVTLTHTVGLNRTVASLDLRSFSLSKDFRYVTSVICRTR